MFETLHVRVVEFSDRRHYQLQWTCPLSGRKKTESSGVVRGNQKARDAATKKAAAKEAELKSGDTPHNPRLTWEQFRERFEREVAAHQSEETQKKTATTFDLVESVLNPKRLAEITSPAVSSWLTRIQAGRSPATAGIYARTLRAALNWAKSVGLLAKAPTFKIPRKAKGETLAKGRPLCGEEHDRVKAAAAKLLPASHVAPWQTFLDALWWSGLRLGEALALSWEASANVTAIVVEGKRPLVRFRAAGQKARRDELWPCPPEFAAMLEAIPAEQRTGFVFAVPKRGRWKGQATKDCAGRTISALGKSAGVIVSDDGSGNATAHAYRRSFGTRWSKRVMPPVLKRLMRHCDIATTMGYYVDADATKIADELWEQFGNTSGNTTPAEPAKV